MFWNALECNTLGSVAGLTSPSEACCNIPPIVSSGYQKKGRFENFDSRNTYVTGPAKEATKAIFIVMDIFGFFDQTLQGCDILASADDHNKYAVFMPDAFDGAPLDISLFPPDNDEKQQKVGAFFGKNSPPSFVPKAHATVKAIQEKYPNIKEWGVLGVSNAGPRCVQVAQ
jgi:dienelactone hydrolase